MTAFAFLSAVRSVERWARLRAVAARVFRMFFFADAMFGTKGLQKFSNARGCRDWRNLGLLESEVKLGTALGQWVTLIVTGASGRAVLALLRQSKCDPTDGRLSPQLINTKLWLAGFSSTYLPPLLGIACHRLCRAARCKVHD